MKIPKKSIGLVFLFFFFSSVWISPGFADSDGIKWYSYDEGMALGEKEGKKVFVFFTAEWCAYCTKMKKETFTDPSVSAYLNENFISVLADYDMESTLVTKYNIRGIRFLFLSESGRFNHPTTGYIPSEKFILAPIRSYRKLQENVLEKFAEGKQK
jgi:thioredoxin-related protein